MLFNKSGNLTYSTKIRINNSLSSCAANSIRPCIPVNLSSTFLITYQEQLLNRILTFSAKSENIRKKIFYFIKSQLRFPLFPINKCYRHLFYLELSQVSLSYCLYLYLIGSAMQIIYYASSELCGITAHSTSAIGYSCINP